MSLRHDNVTVLSYMCSNVVYYYSLPSVEGDDYTVMSPDVFEAVFTSGSMIGDTACDSITIMEDDDLEGTQSFGIQISGSTPSGDQIMTDGVFTTVFIEDNEGILCMRSVLSDDSITHEKNMYIK